MKNKKEVKKSFMDSFEGMKKEHVNIIMGGDSGSTTTTTDPLDGRNHQTIKIIREIDPA